MDKSQIELRVNTNSFVTRNSLHSYLTLEFQMMHEYISHLLAKATVHKLRMEEIGEHTTG